MYFCGMDKATIVRNIENTRKEKGMSKTFFAKSVGLTLSGYTGALIHLTINNMLRFADALGVPPAQLLQEPDFSKKDEKAPAPENTMPNTAPTADLPPDIEVCCNALCPHCGKPVKIVLTQR